MDGRGPQARFHKQHHEYKGTIGFAAEYAHPVSEQQPCPETISGSPQPGGA